MSAGRPYFWRSTDRLAVARWTRRHLAVDSRKFSRMQCDRRPRWRWWTFSAFLWLAWRVRRPWTTRLAGLACTVEFMGFDYPGSWWPVDWPKWMRRREEMPF